MNLTTFILLLMSFSPMQGAVVPTAEVVRNLQPLSVSGVNYYPRETPWGGMWTKTPPEIWERDMQVAASLGINTVRTFLTFFIIHGPARSAARRRHANPRLFAKNRCVTGGGLEARHTNHSMLRV